MSVRCYVPGGQWTRETIDLDPDTAHHVSRVLRVQPGDRVELFNGRGEAAQASIVIAGKKGVTVRVGARWKSAPPQPEITLAAALIRSRPMEWMLTKAVELGVTAFQPVLTTRCVARPRERPERWMKTVVAACEQCGVNWMPTIHPVKSWAEFLAEPGAFDHLLLGSLQEQARPLKTVLGERGAQGRITVLIGPEGDFTPEESESAIAAGAIPVSLGNLTLRAETASLYMLAALHYENAEL